MKFIETSAEIINSIELNNELFQIVVSAPSIARIVEPGQFVGIKIGESTVPLLRRPFSVWTSRDGSIEFLIKVQGYGTKILSEKQKGKLSIIGPLGNPYPQPVKDKTLVFIAGGIGAAPLSFFSERKKGFKRIFLYGSKSSSPLYLLNRLEENCDRFYVSTDDGSIGFKGTVLELFKDLKEQREIEQENSIFYVCGPYSMMKEAQELMPIDKTYVSMEAVMACGFGICMGCSVQKRKADGFLKVCTDGPLFPLSEILL